jgi:hypothetical protein
MGHVSASEVAHHDVGAFCPGTMDLWTVFIAAMDG